MSSEQMPAAIERGARALSYQAHMRDPIVPPTWWDEARECLSEALDVEEMAATIWEASRADESTISATGAKIVAQALRERMLGAALPHLATHQPGEVVVSRDEVLALLASQPTVEEVRASADAWDEGYALAHRAWKTVTEWGGSVPDGTFEQVNAYRARAAETEAGRG